MSTTGFISRRFNRGGAMPRSLRTMRAVAGAGVAVAVAALVISASVGAGFEREYRRALLDFNAHVIVTGGGEFEDSGLAMESIDRSGIEGIVSAAPFLYREALLMGPGGIRGVVVKGIDASREGALGGMGVELDRGGDVAQALRRGEAGWPVLMGRAMARSMPEGGDLTIVIPGAVGEGERFEGIAPVGTFESGMHDYDAEFLLMDIDAMRSLFHAGDAVASGIELRLGDPEDAQAVAGALEQALGPYFGAMTWGELNHDLLAAVRLERLVSAVIMGVMLAVASLNIVAVLVLTTIRRMDEIAMLKAMGLEQGKIASLFVRGGMGVGLRGVLAGLGVGLAASWLAGEFGLIPLEAEIYMIDSLPIDISWSICGIVVFFCALVIWLASNFAARRLARIDPAEGLAQAR